MKVTPLAACALGVALAATLASASCTHGLYDGHEGDAGDTVTVAFRPGQATKGKSTDGVLEIGVPGDAFAAPTTLRIARGADRASSNVTVPTYDVTADADLTGKVSVSFTGNGGSGAQPSSSFVVVRLRENGVTPLPATGRANDRYWGIAQALGTFSVESVELRGYRRPTAATSTCVERCCAASGPSDVAYIAGRSCFCDGQSSATVDLACLLACDDVSGDAARCEGRAASQGSIPCPAAGNADPSATAQCTAQNANVQVAPVCCAESTSKGGDPCGLVGCTGAVVRCASQANCAAGFVCCALDDEVRCSATCPAERRICDDASECAGAQVTDGGASCAKPKARCPYGTCGGEVPAACR